jgi:invasion protein IalB
MNDWIATAAAMPTSRTRGAAFAHTRARRVAKSFALSIPVTVALALAVAPHSFAEQPPANPPAAPVQAAPSGGKTEQGSPGETGQSGLILSPWTKFCVNGDTPGQPPDAKDKKVCFTGSDAHLETGDKLVVALLMEPQGDDKKLLRITVPLGVQLPAGTRIVIDENEPITAPYLVCAANNGCIADYKADAGLITKLKNGRRLTIQAFEKGRPLSIALPLDDFAKAFDGPPTEPGVAPEEQQR